MKRSKRSGKKLLITVAVVAVIVGIGALMNLRPVETFEEKYAGVDLEADVAGVQREGTYAKYLAEHANAANPSVTVPVDLFSYTATEGVEVKENYEGAAKVLYTENLSQVTWKIDVPESGFYNLEMEFLAPKSAGIAVERGILINGKEPFSDALNVSFTRIWTDGGEVTKDNQGNEIRPTQIEVIDWQTTRFRDDRGYVADPYKFYLEKGENEISMKAANEPLAIKSLAFVPVEDLDTSDVNYLAEYDAYYNYTSDYAPGMFICTRGEIDGDIVRLYEESDIGTDVLTLKKSGVSYLIVAHQQIES